MKKKKKVKWVAFGLIVIFIVVMGYLTLKNYAEQLNESHRIMG